MFEQLLIGEEKCFLGSRPSTLPGRVNRVMGAASMRLATALQELGYVGRCSFDMLLHGDPEGDFTVRFIECNGRWGGTSTPMHLVDRVVAGPRPVYRAQDFEDERLVGVPFKELTALIGDRLYNPATGAGSYLLYNVGPLAERGKFDVIALADSPEASDDLIS